MTDSVTVPGIRVGHAQDDAALTGCTVVLAPEGATGAVDVRGGAPGTRETDLLDPTATVQQIHAITLCGGSAFGLAAANGVVKWLYEQRIGYETGVARVPIVPAAVIFDLALGRADRWPDAAMGYAACAAATATFQEGNVGAGCGATCGKLLGMEHAIKSGVGVASETLADGTVVAALVVCNALGDIWRDGSLLAGARDRQRGGYADATRLLRDPQFAAGRVPRAGENTTLAVVMTSARLNKADARKLAQMAQNGLARAIRPVHTPLDGDAVFVMATNRRPAPSLLVLGSVAADVVAGAVVRSVTEATVAGGLPAQRDIVP